MNGWVLWHCGMGILNSGLVFIAVAKGDETGGTVFMALLSCVSVLLAGLSWRENP